MTTIEQLLLKELVEEVGLKPWNKCPTGGYERDLSRVAQLEKCVEEIFMKMRRIESKLDALLAAHEATFKPDFREGSK